MTVARSHLLACCSALASLEGLDPVLEVVAEYAYHSPPVMWSDDLSRYLLLLAQLRPASGDRLRSLALACGVAWPQFAEPAPLTREQLNDERRGRQRALEPAYREELR